MKITPMQTLKSIPTVSEKDADPSVSAIFEDIKNTLEVPFVNLIWRHLATIPSGLSMTWSLAKPLYFSETLDASARAMRKQASLVDTLTPWPEPVRSALGLTPKDKSEIVLLLEDYGHANSRALLVLSYLHRSIANQSPQDSKAQLNPLSDSIQLDPLAHLRERKESQIKPARPLPAPGDLPIAVADLVKILNTFGAPIPTPAEPSLYRHLAYWPSFLAAFWLVAEPLEQKGLLVREGIAMQERAFSIVSQWKPAALKHDAIAAGSVKQVLVSIDHFTHAVISRMIVHGDMMRRMID
ncbi:hypothetical protein [Zwartia sp.]|uniref:hypothetical protein n=1 Tax=Zwartia sp. TaxID=2978004 RepID=UPI00271C849A|nr:hypothetical protein [Zwartia sp.]MDO9025009.1 hypothetical protein [Zwartia sp.]